MDIKGKKFYRLLVLYRVGVNKSRNILWRCLCDCGNETTVSANHLRDGHTKSCGCLHREVVTNDLKNKIFGRLKVVCDSGSRDRDKNVMWKCVCSCGTKITTSSRNLLRGDTVSCGCYARERGSECNKSKLLDKRFGRLLVKKELNSSPGRILWQCLCDCGNIIKVSSSSLNSGNTKSCGCLQREKASIMAAQRVGPKSHSWKGGISCEPYCQDWTKEYKNFIKERDGNKCLNPDCWGNNKLLSVHHVDYNKKNCIQFNLITLCRSCNTRANKDRDWHEVWYKSIIHRRYNK